MIYTPGNHLQASGFTFENASNKETYNVKLTEKLNFVEQSYTWNKTKFDFKALYRDMNMIFVYIDGEFFGSSVGYVEQYNEFLNAHPQRCFKIPDDKLKVLKSKYPNFSLTHFWEYKI